MAYTNSLLIERCFFPLSCSSKSMQNFRPVSSSWQSPSTCKEIHQNSFTRCHTVCSSEKCNCFAMQNLPPEMPPFEKSQFMYEVYRFHDMAATAAENCNTSHTDQKRCRAFFWYSLYERKERKLTQNPTVLEETNDEKDRGRAVYGTMQHFWQNCRAHLYKPHTTA